MSTLTLTYHCQARMQQRGITQELIDFVISYGEATYLKGAEVFRIPRSEEKMVKSETKISRQFLEKALSVYVVVAENTVVTVAKSYKKLKA